MKTNLWGMGLEELTVWVRNNNWPSFRAKQICDYLYKRHIISFDEMKQLPQIMRTWLAENACVEKPIIVNQISADDGRTTKILLKLKDGSLVETVCMHHEYGNSVCISTQVGCAMGCIFCASTQKGLLRNLSSEEMLAQLFAFPEVFNMPIHSIVLMGAGEPLQNYNHVIRFLHMANDKNLLNISYRNITVSTCGIVPQIYKLADEGLPITLAISLHAPNDVIRNELLPISRNYKIEDVIRAARYYFTKTKRRVTFEYILIQGKNTDKENAEELCRLVGKLPCHFNLIPVNGTEHIHLYPPDIKEIRSFQKILMDHGKETTVRKQMGDEIQAACGQLKRRFLENSKSVSR